MLQEHKTYIAKLCESWKESWVFQELTARKMFTFNNY